MALQKMPLVARFTMSYIFSGTVLDTAIFTSRIVPNAEVTVNNNLQLPDDGGLFFEKEFNCG
jgi:hypothetical protein